ncbi:hypothetical protein BS78_04G018100 [Paspalum vaginatum]|nr:hypothetical protein BS78_04G018100 [Paspalum vaginatum]
MLLEEACGWRAYGGRLGAMVILLEKFSSGDVVRCCRRKPADGERLQGRRMRSLESQHAVGFSRVPATWCDAARGSLRTASACRGRRMRSLESLKSARHRLESRAGRWSAPATRSHRSKSFGNGIVAAKFGVLNFASRDLGVLRLES